MTPIDDIFTTLIAKNQPIPVTKYSNIPQANHLPSKNFPELPANFMQTSPRAVTTLIRMTIIIPLKTFMWIGAPTL